MQIVLIAALSPDGIIGDKGSIPWKYPKDQQYFKQVTMGHPVLMGRKTFESLRRPLKGRLNLVLTRSADFAVPAGVLVFSTLDAALARCRQDNADKAFIIGGTELYRLAMPEADLMLLTHVPDLVQGDACFPAWSRADWEEFDTVEEQGLRYSTYRRIRPPEQEIGTQPRTA